MRKLQLTMLALLMLMAGCKKEEIATVTKSTGMVIERSTDEPLAGIKVAVSNGQRDLVKTTTDADGNFELDVDFERVTESDSLLLDGSPDLPSRKFELKGFGKAEYNYGRLWLYDKSDESQLPAVTTDSIVSVGSTTADVAGTVASDGGFDLLDRGVCYATHQSPTLNDSIRSAGSEMGDFTCRLSGLELNTTYYVRAYATNSIGTKYGGQMSFTTISGLAEVITGEAIEVTALSAVLGGNVLDDGGYAIMKRGVCYGQTPMPSFADNVKEAGVVNETGEFTCEVDGLIPTTNYYFRAFAINVVDTVFGTTKSFRTTDGKPSVVTANATNVTETSAILGGEVTNDGGYSVTKRGVCYARHQSPDFNDITVVCGSGTGTFSQDVTNLTPLAVYYCRAFAINAIDTVFGEQKSFTAINGMPSVTTLQVTNILPTSATAGGTVTDDGGHNVTERGVCWSTEHHPDLDDNHAQNGTGLGSFTVQMTGLTPSTRYYVRAYAKNSEGTSFGNEESFTTPGISVPTVSTQPVTNITRTTALGGGVVSSDGGAAVIERGVCWSSSPNPTISGSHAASGVGEGSYTVQMTGLTPNTIYYVKAYAINSQGEGYGEEKTFRTENISSPLVTTSQVTNITQTTATGGGNVTDEGGGTVTERGICWSLSENPTIADSHAAANGGGTGIFTVQMTGLVPGKIYHVRAYAKNGTATGYGNDVTFTTNPIQPPTVSTSQVTNVTQTTATGGGNVTADGGAAVTERGICWSTSPNPTVDGSHAYSGTGLGSFTVQMTGLTPGTNYYVRAYAKNSAETGYGTDAVFTTLPIGEPTVTTTAVTSITQNTAVSGGNVTADGGSPVIERGICWGTSDNPTISGSHLSSGSGIGAFTLQMSGLTSNTTYHVRAYAKNVEKVGYGNDVEFHTLAPPPPTGAIAGLFTINNSGGKVYFSQGNLQYIGSAGNPYWKFAENQWDCLGNNGQGSTSQNVDRDLFGWGTSGWHNEYDNFNVNYQPWATSRAQVNQECNKWGYGPSTNMPDPDLTGSSAHYDWGVHNPISNGGNQAGLWRTLTKDEWVYVFSTRQASTVGGTANARFAKATVNGVGGVILFPDEYIHPSYLPTPLQINATNANLNVNSYSGNAWTAMEDLGCVFLPAAGDRYGTSVSSVGSLGTYWSASYYNSYYAYGASFGGAGLSPAGEGDRFCGQSVRLVCPAE